MLDKTHLHAGLASVIVGGLMLCLAPVDASAQPDEYKPIGGRIGSFIAYPVLEIDGAYNDNLYREDSGRDSGWITRVRPTLAIQSDWNRHAVRLELGAEAGFHTHDSDDDYFDFLGRVDSVVDVTRAARIYFDDVGYENLHENRGADDVPSAAAEPIEYDRFGGRVGFDYRPNRFGIDVSGGFYRFNYDDVAMIGGGMINNDDRDRDSYDVDLTLSYEIQPGYDAYVRGGYMIQRYDSSVDDSGLARDSDGYRVEAGLAFEASPLVRFDIAAGYIYVDYDDPTLSNADGLSLRGDATWFATEMTTVGLALTSEVQETIDPGAAGRLANGAELTVEHELMRNVVLDLNLGFARLDYQGGMTDRTDHDFGAGVGAAYWLNRNFYTGVSYDFLTRESDASGEDFNNSIFLIKLGSQF